MGLLLGAAFAGLSYRLIDLQVLRHTYLTAKAQANTHNESLLEPRRGDILDSKGNLLATSVPAKTVCADPGLIGDRKTEQATQAWREAFANALGRFQRGALADAESYFRRTLQVRPEDGPSRFYLEWIAQHPAERLPATWFGEIELGEK